MKKETREYGDWLLKKFNGLDRDFNLIGEILYQGLAKFPKVSHKMRNYAEQEIFKIKGWKIDRG